MSHEASPAAFVVGVAEHKEGLERKVQGVMQEEEFENIAVVEANGAVGEVYREE